MNSIKSFFNHHYATNKEFMVSLLILLPIQICFWVLSFIYVDDDGKPAIWNWGTKLIPVLCDIASVIILVYKEPKNRLRIFVLVALILSVIGTKFITKPKFTKIADALLIPDNLFLEGLVCFAIAHIFFILAFSLKPFPDAPKVQLHLLYSTTNTLNRIN